MQMLIIKNLRGYKVETTRHPIFTKLWVDEHESDFATRPKIFTWASEKGCLQFTIQRPAGENFSFFFSFSYISIFSTQTRDRKKSCHWVIWMFRVWIFCFWFFDWQKRKCILRNKHVMSYWNDPIIRKNVICSSSWI